jgi:hypothetical protein
MKMRLRIDNVTPDQERALRRLAERMGLKVVTIKRGRPRVDAAIERKAQQLLGAGTGILKTAKTLGLGYGTVHRISRELAT